MLKILTPKLLFGEVDVFSVMLFYAYGETYTLQKCTLIFREMRSNLLGLSPVGLKPHFGINWVKLIFRHNSPLIN